jgi:hypothetical protein
VELKYYQKTIYLLIGIFVLLMINLFFNDIQVILNSQNIESFSLMFLSILLEAFPFVMIGTFVSSLLQIYVSEEMITRIIPNNKVIGIILAALMGLIFPVCECAIIPIVRRLIKKGVPVYIGITFMLAVPIVNPVVLTSTYYAFPNQPQMVVLRALLGFVGAIIIGSIVGYNQEKRSVLKTDLHSHHEHNHHQDLCCCHHHHEEKNEKKTSKFFMILDHMTVELYEVGRFLILGAFLSATMQAFVSRSFLISIGSGNVSSILVLMVVAFILSLCSEADAFIARTFIGQFTTGSVLAFMIYGPMTDVKNTLMMYGAFKSKFVNKLLIIISIVCFMLAILVNMMNI